MITTKLFISGMTCTKKMYMDIHHPELAEKSLSMISFPELEIFRKTVQNLIAPGGINNAANPQKFLKRKGHVLYDMNISHEEQTANVDIIRNNNGIIEAYIIVPATELTEVHYYQSAFILNCLLNAGYNITAFFIAHVNKNYIQNGSVTIDLVNILNVTVSLKKLIPRIKKKIEYFKKLIQWEETPENDVGLYCFKPVTCCYKKNCWPKEILSNSIFDVRNLRTTKKLGYYYRDIKTFDDLIEKKSHKLTDAQLIQINSTLQNKIAYRIEPIQEWFKQILEHEFVCFLDFETIGPIIPLSGLSPYTKIPVQYSLHILNIQTNELMHYEFLGNSVDPRSEFLESLLSSLSGFSKESIVVYNKVFENSILHKLGKQFPKHEKIIQSIQNRLVDLLEIFKQNFYYDPRFKNFSIKNILPVVCPEAENSYSELKINSGLAASTEYQKLLNGETDYDIRQHLLAYCKMDTYAEVLIFFFLQRLINSETETKS